MQKAVWILMCLLIGLCLLTGDVYANEEITLNARAAVLMDADSGRILYEKDGETAFPMASTTKIMTLIIALENADGETIATASEYAASMPEVRLGVRKGEQYRLGDLYYALMLESFNDAAVMIAETVAGSVEAFAEMMNAKALSLGCTQTHFITPNGLDASDADGVHAASAKDMALIMRYAIENEEFLKITQTRTYAFEDLSGSRSFSLYNKNSLFDRMDGVLSGKTGYTADAGYCYVCAVQVGDKCLIAALLGSGWPPNKNYKWTDVKALMDYGDSQYDYQTVHLQDYVGDERIAVKNGVKDQVKIQAENKDCDVLLTASDRIYASVFYPAAVSAPVSAGADVGKIILYVNDYPVAESHYTVSDTIEKKQSFPELKKIWECFILP